MRSGCRGISVLVMATLMWSAEVYAQEAVAGELDQLAERVAGAEHPAEALAAAHQMGNYRTFMAPQEFAARLTALADETDVATVQFVLRRLAARSLLEISDDSEFGGNDGFADAQSCLVNWDLVGPFENASMQGFYDRLPPEEGAPGPYSGRLVEIDWRGLGDAHHLCSYQLGSRVHPATSAVTYLATTVEVDEEKTGQLLVGSRSAYRIWVNGEPLGQRTGEFGLGLDGEGWPVKLNAGSNEILVKLGSSGQGGLSWIARLVDEDGGPMPGLVARASRPVEEVAQFVEEQEQQLSPGGARALIEDAIRPEQPEAVQLWAAHLWQNLFTDDAATPWRDVADRLEPLIDRFSPREILVLAELYEEHWKRQALLDGAVARDGDDELVRLKRARERGGGRTHLEWDAQRRELEQLVEENPRFLMAILDLTGWYERHEGWPRALRTLERWDSQDRESTPEWLRMAATLQEQSGDAHEARRLRARTAEITQLSGTFGWQLVREAVSGGENEEALRRVQTYREYAPWSRSWGLQEIMLRRAGGELDEALAILDSLIEEAPGDATLRERRAELLVASGQPDLAMEAVEDAIALRPQATRLQEYLEHLQPESDRFYEPWVVTELRELDEETPKGAQSYDFLVDQRIHRVSSNGLGRQFVQRAHRVIADEGINGARSIRITHRRGDDRVEVLGVRVYKADGTISEDFNQWRTTASQRGTTTYNDSAYVNLRANNVDVGDIVEFRYLIHQVANENFRGDYFGNVAYIQRTRPVALSRYAVIHPLEWQLYFREPTLEHRRWENSLPGGDPLDGEKVTAFELRNLPRVFTESNQPGHADVYDHIMVSNKENYDEIGRWWWNLIEEQLVVDDAIRAQVAELTGHLDTEAAKVEAIYDFVARNTRYLHMGLGIHGWKPYRTSTVLRNRYGDCKDKSALLKVMIEEAGIEANMVLVRTRRLGAVGDFPASMHVFNHAVTYVPSMDLYLDATAEFNGPYELTSMDQGAQALIIHDGGKTEWTTMPIDSPDDNLMRQVLDVDLSGELPVITGRVEAHGAHAVSFRRSLEDEERRNEQFERQLARTFPGVQLIEAEYENLNDLHAPTEIRYTAEAPGILRGAQDSRSFYPFAAPRDLLGAYARESTRNQDRTIRVPFANEAEIRYRLPEGTGIERVPDPTVVESPFGEMRVDYQSVDGELLVDIRYSFAVQRVSVADYPEFRRFVGEMHEALNETIRLIGEEVHQ